MLEKFHSKRTLAESLGVDREPSRAAPYLRALLAFAKEVPGVGWTLKGGADALKELSEVADDQDLDRKFEELVDIGKQSQDQIAFLATVSAAIYDQQARFTELLSAAQLTIAPTSVPLIAKAGALTAYRSRIAQEHQYVDQRGIPGGGRGDRSASLPLDEVYVLPDLVPEREQQPVQERARELLHQLTRRREECDPGELARMEVEYLELAGHSWRVDQAAHKARKPLTSTLGEARQAVVIGSPGVGKSTLARFLARVCALGRSRIQERLGWDEDLVPVLVPLASFAEKRRERNGLMLWDFVRERLRDKGGEALAHSVEDALREGGAYVLLDGVDEIPQLNERIAVVRAVEGFLRDFGASRYLVTSRPYGYERLSGEIPHFHLPNFTQLQVDEFVKNRHRAVELRLHPEAPDLHRAETDATGLLSEIRRNPKVAELSTNPLILVIVSIIRYEQARLPQERVQLYHRAVETLMDTWNACRSEVALEVGGTTLPRDRLIRVWAAVASWMRQLTNTGIVHREELKRRLVEVLRDREYDEDEPEATAEAYLLAAAARAGLLEERGPGIFGFWHPTFEEFLAAVETATPMSDAAEKLLEVCDDPRWREVVLLSVGYVGVVRMEPETASRIIDYLLETQVPFTDPLVHSRLLLVAACIADDVGVRRKQVDKVLLRFAEVVTSMPYEPFVSTFASTVAAIPRHRPATELIRKFGDLKHHGSWQVRMAVAQLSSNIVPDDSGAVDLCRTLLGDPDPDVRCHAALGLARMGDYGEAVIDALSHYQSSAANAEILVRDFVSNAPVAFRDALNLRISSGIPSSGVVAASLLLRATDREVAVGSTLLKLTKNADYRMRLQAVRALRAFNYDDDLRPTLLEIISKGDEEVAFEAVREMRAQGHEYLGMATRFLNSENPSIRFDAALFLEHAGQEQVVIDAMLDAISREEMLELNSLFLFQLRQMIGKQELRELLQRQLGSDNPQKRLLAASQLHSMGENDDLVPVLSELLRSDNLEVRLEAASILLTMGYDAGVGDALHELLKAEDVEVRIRVASLLRQIGREDETVDVLSNVLRNDNFNVRLRAIRILQAMGQNKLVKEILPEMFGVAPFMEELSQMLSRAFEAEGEIEAVLRRLEPAPWQTLAACQKLLAGELLTEADIAALKGTVSTRLTDTAQQRHIRRAFYQWLRPRVLKRPLAFR